MTTAHLSDRYRRLEGTFIDRERTRTSVALVGGAGALGNEVAKNLAMLGCGRILLVDSDIIEFHNATRSVLLCVGDLEAAVQSRKPKASFVAENICAINPDVLARPFVGDIRELGPGIYRHFDMVFSTFDNLRARFVMAERCARSEKIMIDGGLGNRADDIASGSVAAYDAASGPCFSCLLSASTRAGFLSELAGSTPEPGCTRGAKAILDAEGVPSTPMLGSIVGGAQALLGIKSLMKHPRFPIVTGEITRWFLARAFRTETLRVRESRTCPFHGPSPKPDIVLDERSGELCLADLLRRGQESANHRRWAVNLPGQVWTHLRCPSCKKITERFATTQLAASLSCPSCSTKGLHGHGEPILVFAGDPPQLADIPLRTLGFALGEQYEIYSIDDSSPEASILVEIGGDFEALWHRPEGPKP